MTAGNISQSMQNNLKSIRKDHSKNYYGELRNLFEEIKTKQD